MKSYLREEQDKVVAAEQALADACKIDGARNKMRELFCKLVAVQTAQLASLAPAVPDDDVPKRNSPFSSIFRAVQK